MKRKYKHVQMILDEAVLAKLKEGVSDNNELRQVVRTTLAHHLTQTGDINVPYLLDALSGTEFSNIKQRLRMTGHIEITKANEAKVTEALSLDDIEFIDQRRASHIKGELETRVEFNHRYGRHAAAAEASRQLLLFGAEEIPANEQVVASKQDA